MPVEAPETEEAVRVVADRKLQVLNHLRCDPSCAQLVARETLFVEHEHIRAGGFETLCGRRARRTATDHYDVDVSHEATAYRG